VVAVGRVCLHRRCLAAAGGRERPIRARPATFTRFIRHWVRERQAVSLLEGVRKCTLIPAEILAASTPDMRAKGRLAAGADADVVVFDLDTLTDRSEFSAMNRAAGGRAGTCWCGGQPVITDGAMDVAARPGRAVRRPVSGT